MTAGEGRSILQISQRKTGSAVMALTTDANRSFYRNPSIEAVREWRKTTRLSSSSRRRPQISSRTQRGRVGARILQSLSMSAHRRDTWLLEIPVITIDFTRSSTERAAARDGLVA